MTGQELRQKIMNFIREKNPVGTFPPIYITLGEIRTNFKEISAADILKEIRTLKFVGLAYWSAGKTSFQWDTYILGTHLGLHLSEQDLNFRFFS